MVIVVVIVIDATKERKNYVKHGSTELCRLIVV